MSGFTRTATNDTQEAALSRIESWGDAAEHTLRADAHRNGNLTVTVNGVRALKVDEYGDVYDATLAAAGEGVEAGHLGSFLIVKDAQLNAALARAHHAQPLR